MFAILYFYTASMLNFVLRWQSSTNTNPHKKSKLYRTSTNKTNFVETYPKNILDFRSAPKTEHYVEERIIRETFMPKLTDDNVYKVVTIAHMMLHIMRCWIGQKE